MIKFFRKIRQQLLTENRFSKYLLYAIGEIVLVVIGILIAVNINERVEQSKDSQLRCTYLNELLYTFEYDIKDVKENIEGFEEWNPKINELFIALKDDRLDKVELLYNKFGTVGNFIFFNQRSKTKIEELKYSNINLIENRELKNKILLYQDNNISFIRILEVRNDLIGEDIRKYYTKNFKGYNYGKAFPLNLKEIKEDNSYFSLVYQRLHMNRLLKDHYEVLIAKQKEIKDLIVQELEKICTK